MAWLTAQQRGRGEDRMGLQRKQQPQPGMVMKLHLLRGSLSSLCTTAAAAATSICPYGCDRVGQDAGRADLGGVAVRAYRQTLSMAAGEPQWRQVLTSAHFRKTLAHLSVVAWVSMDSSPCHMYSSNTSINVKAWEVDLSTVVPSSFWRERDNGDECPGLPQWTVVVAAQGLVCISNYSELRHYWYRTKRNLPEEAWELCKPWASRYCMLNPVTRTCVVLPPLPFKAEAWLPPTSTTVTILGCSSTDPSVWALATYDLAPVAAGRTGGWVTRPVPSDFQNRQWSYVYRWWAMMGGQTYRYNEEDHKVHVTAPCPGGGGGHVVVAVLDVPSATLPGADASSTMRIIHTGKDFKKVLVAHRGIVYFVAHLVWPEVVTRQSALCGVWQLVHAANRQMEWEGVAVLDALELERLTGLTCGHAVGFLKACVVREFVCCGLVASEEKRDEGQKGPLVAKGLLGFNLDTGKWELLSCGYNLSYGKVLELRSDLFLSSS